MNDLELLRTYVREGSQAAFAELARRYVNLVYSAAMRHVHDPHDAEDVTQAVFFLLARKAKSLGGGVVVPGWLLRATHMTCLSWARGRNRRKKHEQRAATMATADQRNPTPSSTDSPDWQAVAGLLDEGIASLNDTLRDAMVLRFFRNKSYKEVADRLAIEEPAARQRVSRAVEQLRTYFARRGVVFSAATFESLVIAHAVHPAPKALLALAAGTGMKGAAIAAKHVALAKGAAFGMVPLATKLGAAAIVMIIIGAGTAAVFWAGRDRSASMSVAAKQPGVTVPAVAAGPLRGRVIDHDGQPVPDAEVMLARSVTPVSVYGPRRDGVLAVNSAQDGTFELPGEPDATAVIVRANRGFAQVLTSDLRKNPDITIMPWGRIEGTVKVGSNPAVHQPIELSKLGGSIAEWNAWRVMHDARTQTDSQGHFVFARVIPSVDRDLLLRWGGPSSGGPHTLTVHVAPRQTLQLELGGTGRPVIGRLTAPPNLPPFSGQLFESTPTTQPVAAAGGTLPQASIPVVVQADGSFRAEDVPAGSYRLNFNCSTGTPGTPFMETVAWADAAVTVPEMSGGRSDEPLDVGTLTAKMNKLLWPGDKAPELAAAGGDGKLLTLSQYRGKYVLVYVSVPGENNPFLLASTLQTIYDRFADDARFAMLQIVVDLSGENSAKPPKLPAVPWPCGTAPIAAIPPGAANFDRALLPDTYITSPTRLFLIGPDGKCIARSLTGRAALSAIGDSMPRAAALNSRVQVRVEHHLPRESRADASFKTVPNPTAEQNVASTARFTVVDGGTGQYSGGTGVLNDGRLASGDDRPGECFYFEWGSLEGRLRIDLAQPTAIRQFNTYSWHNSHRAPQVYKVYASDGTARSFNPSPKIGTDPASCGWTRIATVDSRPASGPDGGQYAVSISGVSGSMGTYRHLLLVAFATETVDDWGGTFFSEMDVIGKPEGQP